MITRLRNQKGSVAVLVTAAMTVLLGFASIVVDVGVLYLNRVQLSNMVDAAALAGARELLPDSDGNPTQTAQLYASLNGRTSQDRLTVSTNTATATITVTVDRNVNLFFAQIFGIQSSQVTATAAASAGAIRAATGILPFGIVQQQLVYGNTYTLKNGGGSGNSGNYGALALGGNGASVYRNNIINGYQGTLQIGDKVSTEPGNMSGPTNQGISGRVGNSSSVFPPTDLSSPRIGTIPVVDTLDVNGRKEVTIVGFAKFFIEDCGGAGNNAWVKGRFMEISQPGDITTQAGHYFGAYNVRLVD